MNLWRGVFAGFFGKIKSEALPVKISCLNGKMENMNIPYEVIV